MAFLPSSLRTAGLMTSLIVGIGGMAGAYGASAYGAEMSARERLLRGLEPRIKVVIHPQAPGATFNLEGDVLVVRYHTRQYRVRARLKPGEPSTLKRREGPEAGGLLMTVQAVLPDSISADPTIDLPHFFVDEFWFRRRQLYALPSGEKLIVNLAYGKETDRALLHRIWAAFQKWSVPDPKPSARKLE